MSKMHWCFQEQTSAHARVINDANLLFRDINRSSCVYVALNTKQRADRSVGSCLRSALGVLLLPPSTELMWKRVPCHHEKEEVAAFYPAIKAL